jgi:hypothetical protein
MSKSVVDYLKEARALIADPKHWITGTAARDSMGNTVIPSSPYAVCWCASGACFKVAKDANLWIALENALSVAASGRRVDRVNDDSSHAEVLAWFDHAIARAT